MTRSRALSGRRGRLPARRADRPRAPGVRAAPARLPGVPGGARAAAAGGGRAAALGRAGRAAAGAEAALMAEVERERRRRAPRARDRCLLAAARRCCCSRSWLSASASRSSAATTRAPSPRRSPRRCRGRAAMLEIEGDRATLAAARHAGPRAARASTRCGCSTATGWSRPAHSRSGADGAGDVAAARASADADGVFVTREARGGAQVPSEAPIVSVPL